MALLFENHTFYARPTLDVARDLIGCTLVYAPAGEPRRSGRIVETEAYTRDDPAFKSWKAKFGPDGEVLPVGRSAHVFGRPGTAYLYKIYGRSWLLNIRTDRAVVAGCVLIRAVEPLEGELVCWANRPNVRRRVDLTNGPGKWTEAFGVDGRLQDADLTRGPLGIRSDGYPKTASIGRSGRIGLRAGERLPFRFYELNQPFVSRGRVVNPPAD